MPETNLGDPDIRSSDGIQFYDEFGDQEPFHSVPTEARSYLVNTRPWISRSFGNEVEWFVHQQGASGKQKQICAQSNRLAGQAPK